MTTTILQNKVDSLLAEQVKTYGLTLGWCCSGYKPSEHPSHDATQRIDDLDLKEDYSVLGHQALLTFARDGNVRLVIETEEIKNLPDVLAVYFETGIGVFIVNKEFLISSFLDFSDHIIKGYWFRNYLRLNCDICSYIKEKRYIEQKGRKIQLSLQQEIKYQEWIDKKRWSILHKLTQAKEARRTLLFYSDSFIVIRLDDDCLEGIDLDELEEWEIGELIDHATIEKDTNTVSDPYEFSSDYFDLRCIENPLSYISIAETEESLFTIKEGDWFYWLLKEQESRWNDEASARMDAEIAQYDECENEYEMIRNEIEKHKDFFEKVAENELSINAKEPIIGQRKKTGLVYALWDNVSAVKIGNTTQKSGQLRAKESQTGNPNELSLLFDSGRYYSYERIEAYLHSLFAEYNCKTLRKGGGEWFELEDNYIVDFMTTFFIALDTYLEEKGLTKKSEIECDPDLSF